MKPQEEALALCQKIGMQTMFDKECNEGYTLPLNTSKKIALVCCDKIIEQLKELSNEDIFYNTITHWERTKEEIQKLGT